MKAKLYRAYKAGASVSENIQRRQFEDAWLLRHSQTHQKVKRVCCNFPIAAIQGLSQNTTTGVQITNYPTDQKKTHLKLHVEFLVKFGMIWIVMHSCLWLSKKRNIHKIRFISCKSPKDIAILHEKKRYHNIYFWFENRYRNILVFLGCNSSYNSFFRVSFRALVLHIQTMELLGNTRRTVKVSVQPSYSVWERETHTLTFLPAKLNVRYGSTSSFCSWKNDEKPKIWTVIDQVLSLCAHKGETPLLAKSFFFHTYRCPNFSCCYLRTPSYTALSLSMSIKRLTLKNHDAGITVCKYNYLSHSKDFLDSFKEPRIHCKNNHSFS